MGYDAYVLCNCYKEGKTVEPPYKEYVVSDEDGIFIHVPEEIWEEDKDKYYSIRAAFDEWKETACEHEDMDLASERIANSAGMGHFRYILEKLGGENRFPVLSEYLPTFNGGILPAEFSQKALDELLMLENEPEPEEKVVLFEKSTGKSIATVNSDTYWLFIYTPYNTKFGIDKDGFFILETVTGNDKQTASYIVFHSKNFIQKKISEDCYEFIDIHSGKIYKSARDLYFDREKSGASEFEFETRIEKVTIAEDYNYIIKPLKKVFEASIQSGNSVYWC